MALSEVHHVALTVSDIDRSVAFYCDVLGFRKTLDYSMEYGAQGRMLRLPANTKSRLVILQQGSSLVGQVELMQFDPPVGEPTGPKRPGDPGVFLLSFEVKGEDLHAAYDRLCRMGIECNMEPQSTSMPGYGTLHTVVFQDPDGVMIELIQLPSPDEVRRNRASRGSP